MSNQDVSNVNKRNLNIHKQTDFNLPKHRGFEIAFLNTASLPKHFDKLRLNMAKSIFRYTSFKRNPPG